MAKLNPVEGGAELAAKLKELASDKEARTALAAAVREPMQKVLARAKSTVAVVSPGETPIHRTYKGRLVTAGFAARSIQLRVKYTAGKATAVIGVLAEAFYALQFFELGTSRIAARPWLQPAFYQSRNETVRLVGEVLKRRIERIAKKRAAGK